MNLRMSLPKAIPKNTLGNGIKIQKPTPTIVRHEVNKEKRKRGNPAK